MGKIRLDPALIQNSSSSGVIANGKSPIIATACNPTEPNFTRELLRAIESWDLDSLLSKNEQNPERSPNV